MRYLTLLAFPALASLLPFSSAFPLRLPRQLVNTLSINFGPRGPIELSDSNYNCSAPQFVYSGLNPPFSLDVISYPYDFSNVAGQQVLKHFGNFTGGAGSLVSWNTDAAGLPVGTHLVIRVEDATGSVAYSSERWIAKGSTATCAKLHRTWWEKYGTFDHFLIVVGFAAVAVFLFLVLRSCCTPPRVPPVAIEMVANPTAPVAAAVATDPVAPAADAQAGPGDADITEAPLAAASTADAPPPTYQQTMGKATR